MAVTGHCGSDEWQSWKTFIAGWHAAGLSSSQMVALLFEQGFYADATRLEQWIEYWDLAKSAEMKDTHIVPEPQSQTEQRTAAPPVKRGCSTKSATPTAKSVSTAKSTKDGKWSVSSKVASPTYSLFPKQQTYRFPPGAPSLPHTAKSSVATSPSLRPTTAPAMQSTKTSTSRSSSHDTNDSRDTTFTSHGRKESAGTTYTVLSDHSFMALDECHTTEDTLSELTLDTLSLQSLPLGRPETSDSAAGYLQNLPRTLVKMEAADNGLPFLECCCADFFSGTKEPCKWTPLYKMLLEDQDFRHTLHYTRAVARLCRTASLSAAMEIRLEEQFQYHNELLDRRDVRNDAAYAIALELAGIRDGIMPDRQEAVLFAQRVMREVYGQQKDVCTAAVELREKYSHLYEGIRKLPIRLRTSRNPSNWKDARSIPRRRFEEKLTGQLNAEWMSSLLSDCKAVITHSENLFALASFAATLQPWSFQDGHTHARKQIERANIVRLGREIRDTLLTNIDLISWPKGSIRHIKTTMLVFDAIGFIVSQAFHEHNMPSQLNEDQAVTYLLNAAGILRTESKFSIPVTGDVININTKLLQAMWICDDRPLFGPQGLHVEACKAKTCWRTLGGKVEQFDKPTMLTAPTALPAKLMPSGTCKTTPQPRRTGLGRLKDLVKFKQKGGFPVSLKSKY